MFEIILRSECAIKSFCLATSMARWFRTKLENWLRSVGFFRVSTFGKSAMWERRSGWLANGVGERSRWKKGIEAVLCAYLMPIIHIWSSQRSEKGKLAKPVRLKKRFMSLDQCRTIDRSKTIRPRSKTLNQREHRERNCKQEAFRTRS